ncbi:hypothetical protein H0X32_02330 [Patescibacteria group bacterium]|nr:hypothetical protein [Patescibacteria group bacterium]
MVELWLAEGQKNDKVIEDNKLRTEVVKKSPFNANVLDYLLANPDLIPEEWKKDEKSNTRHIFFWGTIYRDSLGSLYVRYLCWGDGRWYWGSYCLDYHWNGRSPAAMLTS